MTSHPFEEGKTYRNRIGEYVVVSIEGDQMEIRYKDGGTLSTSARIQSRIWENIQFEERAAREEERDRLAREARLAARKRIREAKAMPKFGGFQVEDLQPKQRGIAWTTRKQLGQVLAYQLSKRTRGSFGQWIVPRQSGVQVARSDKFQSDRRDRNSAFFVEASEAGVSCGFYVGKPEGKAQATLPWSRTLAALAEGEKLRRSVRAAMKAHDLSLRVYAQEKSYGLVGEVSVEGSRFVWRGKTEDQEATRSMTWNDLIEALEGLGGKRSELYLGKQVPAGEALEAAAQISSQILEVFEALMPIYDTSVGI